MFLCQVVWGHKDEAECPDSGHIEMKTLDELENFFYQFKKEHQEEKATIVEVILPSGKRMAIALGRQESFLCYCSKPFCSYPGEPEFFQPRIYYESLGNHDNESQEIIEFWDGCRYNEYKKYGIIPEDMARYAIRYFVQTGGKLTQKVTWKKYDKEKTDHFEDGEDEPF